MANSGLEISVRDLKDRLDKGDDIFILDIREANELDVAKINHDLHIPMGQLSARHGELAPHKDKDIVVLCRSGSRSMRCVQFLRANGYSSALNLQGGILAWADEIDNSVQKY